MPKTLDKPIKGKDVRAFAEENWDEFAKIIGEVLAEKAKFEWGVDNGYKAHFEAWQKAGVSILPNHFYSPVPDVSALGDLSKRLPMHGVDWRLPAQFELLSALKTFQAEYLPFASRGPDTVGKFRFGGAFPPIDAEVTYAMTRHFKPPRIIEIGSGFSTLVFAEAIEANAAEGHPCEFITIDPYVAWSIKELPAKAVKHIHKPVEEVSETLFTSLGENDFLFIDSSHVWRPGNDVDFEYFKLLPIIKSGVIIHIHDIFLPYQYPAHWLTREHVFWNEQMILAAMLAFNPTYQILLANSMMTRDHPSAVKEFLPNITEGANPGSFWMRRR